MDNNNILTKLKEKVFNDKFYIDGDVVFEEFKELHFGFIFKLLIKNGCNYYRLFEATFYKSFGIELDNPFDVHCVDLDKKLIDAIKKI